MMTAEMGLTRLRGETRGKKGGKGRGKTCGACEAASLSHMTPEHFLTPQMGLPKDGKPEVG